MRDTAKSTAPRDLMSQPKDLKAMLEMKAIANMNKLYIGNLPAEVEAAAVHRLLLDQKLPATRVAIKRGGYAFVDFPDQSSADKAVDQLRGMYNSISSISTLPYDSKSFILPLYTNRRTSFALCTRVFLS